MMRIVYAIATAALMLGQGTGSSRADVLLSGTFTAERECPAFQSFRGQTNPGGVHVEPGQIYPLIAKNREDASHYRVRVEGAQPIERWVAIGCGAIAGADDDVAQPGQPSGTGKGRFVLALSWQPAFCEGHAKVTECETQTAGRPDATNFTLHGLWPSGGSYCGVPSDLKAEDSAHRWEELPEPEIGPALRQDLDAVMPGTASLLHRHEWIKHGTCYTGGAEPYFRESVRLIREINGSEAKTLLASRIGRKVTSEEELRAAFDRSFGMGAGERIRLKCVNDGPRRLLVEITVGLVGDPSAGTPMKDLIAASSPTDAGCNEGIVDPVGLQ